MRLAPPSLCLAIPNTGFGDVTRREPSNLFACLLAALAARRHWIVGNMWVRVYTVTEDNVKGKRGAAAHSQL